MAFVPAILLLTIMLKWWSKAATNINEQEWSPQSLLQKRISGTSRGQFNIECPQHRQTITQATAWKLYLMLWEVIPIGHWKKRTGKKNSMIPGLQSSWNTVQPPCQAWTFWSFSAWVQIPGQESEGWTDRGDSKATMGATADAWGPRQGGDSWEVGRKSHSIHRCRDNSSLGDGTSHSKEIGLGPKQERKRCWSAFPPLRRENVSLFPP